MKKTAILGISAYYHDSAAALIVDGEIVAAAHEERFTRKKHDARFPSHAVQYVLDEAGVTLPELTAIAFYDKPFLKFERLLETYHAFAPRGLKSFLQAIPVWIKEKLFMRHQLWEALEKVNGGSIKQRPPLLFPEHHLSHAASAYYPSPFTEAAILTLDGVGEWATTTICAGKGKDITLLKELTFPHSIGLLYSAFTYYCGFKVNSGEYKLMGLAPYGNPDGDNARFYKEQLLAHVVDLREDGSLLLNMDYFDYATGLRMCHDKKWEALLKLPRRESESPLTQDYMDLALAAQQITEECIMRLARTVRTVTGLSNLVLAGGVALNCVANGKLLKSGIFEDIWIQPAAGDAGGALGAALAAHHIWLGKDLPAKDGRNDLMKGAYLGPEYSDLDTERMIRKYSAVAVQLESEKELTEKVAALLDEGNVIGWFQGRAEWGPRALGNRSIIADPRKPDMQKKLNLKIKYREGFRPFAPSVLEEQIGDYFDITTPSPYMLLVADVKKERQVPRPDHYTTLPMYDRLYFLRSDLPSITHVDYSARIQSVSKDTNPAYWQLLNAFYDRTGYGVLVNTSFNVRGEPMVLTPEDAYRCFMRTEMDYLVVGNFVFAKKEQPEFEDTGRWRDEFELD